MNKIFRIVWNEAAQAWVAVSELTKKHKKRASVTAVAVALVAGMLSPFAEASETASRTEGVNSKDPSGGYTTPRKDDLKDPNDEDLRGLGFGLAVVGKDGSRKPIKTIKEEGKEDVPVLIDDENTEDDDKKSTVITVELNSL